MPVDSLAITQDLHPFIHDRLTQKFRIYVSAIPPNI